MMMVTLAVEEEGGSKLDPGTSATTCWGSCRVEEEHGIT